LSGDESCKPRVGLSDESLLVSANELDEEVECLHFSDLSAVFIETLLHFLLLCQRRVEHLFFRLQILYRKAGESFEVGELGEGADLVSKGECLDDALPEFDGPR